VQTGFILKNVQVPPLPLKAVINTLVDFVEQGESKGLEPSLNVELFTTQSTRSSRTTIHQSSTHTIA
jgi:hypothetical protein